MTDHFRTHSHSLTAPASAGQGVAPNDAADLPVVSRAIYVGVGGTLTVELVDQPAGHPLTLDNVPSGTLIPLRVRRVRATGTTAAGLVSLW